MKSKVFLNGDRTKVARETTIWIKGKGGELGIKAFDGLAVLIKSLQDCETREEVRSRFDVICGYNACCRECEFIDEKGADELMKITSIIASQEIVRCERQSKNK